MLELKLIHVSKRGPWGALSDPGSTQVITQWLTLAKK